MRARKSLWVAALALVSCAAWWPQGRAGSAEAPAGAGGGGHGGRAASAGAASLVATLEAAEPEARLRLTVENRGTSAARLLRLRPGWLEYNGGSLHGWEILIDGPGGRYQLPRHTGAVRAPTEKDFIELAPGEAFATVIDVSGASRYGDGAERHDLPRTAGTYTVTVSRPALRSNALRVSVGSW